MTWVLSAIVGQEVMQNTVLVLHVASAFPESWQQIRLVAELQELV